MDIQTTYIPPHTEVVSSSHYASNSCQRKVTQSSFTFPPTQVKLDSIDDEEEPINTPVPQQVSNSPTSDDQQQGEENEEEEEETFVDDKPTYSAAMYLACRDKRKSSPAVLGLLGLGEEAESKLSIHLSQHRNSIEAAMLLANFNRPQQQSRPSSQLEKKSTWQDTMSVDSNPDRKSTSYWEDAVQATRQRRRYSYDSKMTWKTMPTTFLEQASLLQELKVKPIKLPSASSSSSSSVISSPYHKSTTWYSDPMLDHTSHPHHPTPPLQQQQQLQRHMQHIQPHHPQMYRPMYPPMHPLATSDQSSSQPLHPLPPPGYYPYPYQSNQQGYYFPGKLPILMDSNNNNNGNNTNGMMMHPPPHLHPLHLQHLQQQHPHAMAASMATPPVKPKRKRRDQNEDEENLGQVMPGDADFPDMGERDVEAARNDVEARPRRQKLRYVGDMYTPQWVRYNGQSKEGLCDTCKPGKWLQLKNSAFWYHKQFFHGISSVSGKEFLQPLETRWVDQDIVEGLCHQCQQWVSVSNVKRKNSVLWYRHAHKCHVYHKPKNGSPKRRGN
ncbi:uncharacterized protein BX664DRAFT_339527 [Halteromyces radiatus]|uniref:uncharacterized protein n=1 Tax=Halteromyces radiatus TaxID=101107 RepID=UPI00221EBDE2|nr:uncharacterized protein BX664DRAFT_339527 [Halteromyces radiatus]KAI8082972.1 hypothetical protein BX664DRAFT_339527 [Halteromyces radiatus]